MWRSLKIRVFFLSGVFNRNRAPPPRTRSATTPRHHAIIGYFTIATTPLSIVRLSFIYVFCRNLLRNLPRNLHCFQGPCVVGLSKAFGLQIGLALTDDSPVYVFVFVRTKNMLLFSGKGVQIGEHGAAPQAIPSYL